MPRLGRLLRGLGESPVALATHGLTVNVTLVLVFCLSAFLAGVDLPGVGLPPRLAYQDCQGTLPQISGVPRASALVATGLTVSGVEAVSSTSTLSDRMAWLARSPARLGSDWVS